MAYIPDSDTDRAEVLRAFLRLARDGQVPLSGQKKGHHDGWGLSLYARGGLLRHFRSKACGAEDPQRENEFFQVSVHKPDTMLAHIRIQTVGEPSEKNSHPFVSGRFSFIHNGTLGSTDQLIFDPVRGQVFGETDSEYYFHLIIRDLDASEEHDKEKVSDAIIRTVHALRIDTAHEGGHFTSASSILTDGRYAYVLREFDEQHPFVQKNNSAGYYTLYLGQGPRDERIVCSEELHIPEVKWELLPNHSLTVVDLATGAFETKPV
jgi:glutamine amidotransferase